ILELDRDDIHPRREPVERCRVVELADDQLRDLSRRSIRLVVEKPKPHLQRVSRQREHPAKLTAAQHAHLHPRRLLVEPAFFFAPRLRAVFSGWRGSESSSTTRVRASRYAFSLA